MLGWMAFHRVLLQEGEDEGEEVEDEEGEWKRVKKIKPDCFLFG